MKRSEDRGFEVRRSGERGSLHNDWLEARFSFSFAHHDDPGRRRFGPLLTLNEDRVQPGRGFPMHAHQDLEIVVLPLRGAIEHHDSQGRHGVLRPGEIQWMRAGRGIRHSQTNPSADEIDHHLQLWFEPAAPGLEPAVAHAPYAPPAAGDWCVLVSPHAGEAVFDIGVDAVLALGHAAPGRPLHLASRRHRGLYLHAIDGVVDVDADARPLATLQPGDALVFFDGAPALALRAAGAAGVLSVETAAAPALSRRRA